MIYARMGIRFLVLVRRDNWNDGCACKCKLFSINEQCMLGISVYIVNGSLGNLIYSKRLLVLFNDKSIRALCPFLSNVFGVFFVTWL